MPQHERVETATPLSLSRSLSPSLSLIGPGTTSFVPPIRESFFAQTSQRAAWTSRRWTG